jgi:hypothetical protein
MPVPTPSSPAVDRNLLFGILALQMDFISREYPRQSPKRRGLEMLPWVIPTEILRQEVVLATDRLGRP